VRRACAAASPHCVRAAQRECCLWCHQVRLLREGKPLTEAQIAAAKDAGVEVERLRDLYGYTDR